MRRPLYHFLYTNAPSFGESGYRHVSVASSDVNPAPIQQWLETLQPVEPGMREGWAFYSFGSGSTLYPVLAVVNPSFSLDDHGKGRTLLIHAFMLPLDNGEAVGQFGQALYEEAKKFLDGSRNHRPGALNSYLAICRAARDLEIQESDLRELRHLDGRFLRALFQAASQSAKIALLPEIATPEDLPGKILKAGAVLPPWLRLQMRWRVGLQSGAKGFVAMQGESDPSDSAGHGAAIFYDWLKRALRKQRFEAIRRLSENWDIRDWDQLIEAIRAPESRPAAAAVASAPRPAASRPDKSASDYGDEYQSLQRDLREYLDERFSTIQDYVEPRAVKGNVPREPWWARLKAWRPEIYFLLLLLLWGLHFFSSTGPG